MIPGCGLMYLGYMKKGLQTMFIFAASCFLAYSFMELRLSWISALFLMLLPIIWFYQLFDTMHTVSRMKREKIDFPQDDGFYMPKKMNYI
jgi:TM2 domain-containing membrane protein YozV